MTKIHYWTDEEIEILIRDYTTERNVKEIAAEIGCSVQSVYSKASELIKAKKIGKRKSGRPLGTVCGRPFEWTNENTAILLALLRETTITYDEIADIIDCSQATIASKVAVLTNAGIYSRDERPDKKKNTNLSNSSYVEEVIKNAVEQSKERRRVEKKYWLERAQLYDMGLL